MTYATLVEKFDAATPLTDAELATLADLAADREPDLAASCRTILERRRVYRYSLM